MSVRLLEHIDLLVTFDTQERELSDACVLWRDGVIVAIGANCETEDLRRYGLIHPGEDVEVLDGRGLVVLPAGGCRYQPDLRSLRPVDCLRGPRARGIEIGAVADFAGWSLAATDRIVIDGTVAGLELDDLSEPPMLVIFDGAPVTATGVGISG